MSYRDQVDKGDGVVIDVPQSHDPNSVHGDHDDGDEVEQAGAQVQTEQQTAHHEGGQQTQGDVEQSLWNNGQVLLIKYIGHPGGRREDKQWLEMTDSKGLKGAYYGVFLSCSVL